MTWAKTDAGRAEIQARALVKERAQRNLLLVIDGRKPDDLLLAQLASISPQDFLDLQSLGLIAPAGDAATAMTVAPAPAVPGLPMRPSPSPYPSPLSPSTSPRPFLPPSPSGPDPGAGHAPEADPAPLDYAQFTAALTRLISKELGLRGFMLTLAVEKASSPQELLAVAERTIEQIRDRRGEASAAAASRVLFGG